MVSSSTHSVGAPPIAGRARELANIEASLDSAASGQCRVVLLSGEPGIGKSRMLVHAATYALDRQMLVLHGHCYEDVEMTPFAPFVEVLRDLVQQRPDLVDTLSSSPAHSALAALVPELAVDDAENSTFTELERRQALHDAFGRLLSAASADKPVVLIVDDLHWADEPSAQLLRHLTRGLRHSSFAVICAYRDTDLEQGDPFERVLIDLSREHLARRIVLRRLDLQASHEIVARIVGASPGRVAVAAVESIQRESEGVPFFVEELTLHLREERLLQPDATGTWSLVRDVASFVPQSVRSVISRRLARLSAPAREVLAVASVSGREFGLSVVRQVAERRGVAVPADVESALMEAIDRRLLVRRELAYSFVHEQIREVLYQGLSAVRRRQLHQLTAEAFERIHGDGPDIASRLAFHYSHGDDLGRALHFTVQAASAAERIHAVSDATRFYTEALEMLELLDLPDRDRQTFDILLARDSVLAAAGNHDERSAGVASLLDGSQSLDAAARVQALDRASSLALARGEHDEALRYGREARQIAGGAPTAERLTALLALGQALAVRPMGEPSKLYRDATTLREAIKVYSEALEVADLLGATRERAQIQQELGVLEWALLERNGDGDANGARGRLLEALEAFRAAGDRKGEVTSLIALAYRRRVASSGEETDVRDSYVSFLEEIRRLRATEHRLVRASERPRMEALALLSIALYGRTNGWYEVALQRGNQALRLAEEARDIRLIVMALVGLSEAERVLGRLPRAIEHAERALVALDMAERGHPPVVQQRDDVVHALAASYARAGHAERAIQLVRESVEQAEAAGPPARLAEALTWLAELAEGSGDHQTADKAARDVLRIVAGMAGGISWDIRAELVLARLALNSGACDLALGHVSAAAGRLAQRELPQIALQIAVEFERWRALRAGGFEADAATALAQAHQRVTRIAERITDGELRSTFLARSPLARDVLAAAGQPAVSPTNGASSAVDVLTRREIEVLREVAAGLPNRDIADRLFISEKTVARHLTNIFTKLDVESRTQAAAWAFRQGIA